MLCDACKKNKATFETIRKTNGVTVTLHLCSECERKLALGADFSAVLESVSKRNEKAEIVCPSCGTRESEMLSSGYVGCARCYEVFYAVIAPQLRKIQQGTRHTGKVPYSPSLVMEDFEKLKIELDRALAVEDYKLATKIKAKIMKLRGGDSL